MLSSTSSNQISLSNLSNSSKFLNQFNSLTDSFWQDKVWKTNYSNIHHQKIYKIIYEYQKIKNKIKQQKYNKNKNKNNKHNFLSINENFDLFIQDEEFDLQKKLEKFVSENIMFLKTHSECFIYYNKLQYNYFNIKNKQNLDYSFIQLNTQKHDIFDISNISNISNSSNINKTTLFIKQDYDFTEFKKYIDFEQDKLSLIINELKNTVSSFKEQINKAIENNKKIIIIDGENILKCFKIQQFIKTILNKDKFQEYFNIWFNGSYQENEDISYSNLSLSEYSSSVKIIEPYSSLSMDTITKFTLLKLLSENLFQDYFCIMICNSKQKLEDYEQYCYSTNSVFIPISYEKKDIREKDDHLIVFLYYYFSINNIEFELLSGDKFKWMTFFENTIKNLKLVYDFDNSSFDYVLSEAHNNDFIKYNNSIYHLSINYFPNPIHFEEQDNILQSQSQTQLKIITLNDYTFLIHNFFIKNCLSDDKFDSESYSLLLENIYNFTKNLSDNFYIIFDFLNKYTKNEIFKLLKKINANKFSSNINFERFRLKIDDYKQLCNLYILIKHINITLNKGISDNIHILTTKIFSKIISIYDEIDNTIFKIRKLSSNKKTINLFFMELNSMFVYIKKIGFFKKQL